MRWGMSIKSKARRWRRQTGWKPTPSIVVRSGTGMAGYTRAAHIRAGCGGKGHKGRTPSPMILCMERAYRHHPDKSVRELAKLQSRASHKLWGPCGPRPWFPLSMFAKNDTTLYLSIKMRQSKVTDRRMQGVKR